MVPRSVVLDHCRREVEAAAEAATVRFERAWEREGLLAESMVLSGGAVNFLEPLARTARRFDRILVCWDGSHNAARAIADAMPFLTRAKQVEVVTVAIGGKADDGMLGLYIAHHLSRHGVIAELNNIVAHSRRCHLGFVLMRHSNRQI
jgi:hypothetical protein